MLGSNHEMLKEVVPSGDQTGIYYIPISNLPFNVSWQQIKDHVRQVCEVDHVEIFHKSACGWVRVKGRENFEAAYRHLDGQELNGRSLCADNRNGNGPLLVRDLLLCKPSRSTKIRLSSDDDNDKCCGAPESPLYAQCGPVTCNPTSKLASPTSAESSSLSQDRVYGNNTSLSSNIMTSVDSTNWQPTMVRNFDSVAGSFPQPASLPARRFGYGPLPMQSHQLCPSYPTYPTPTSCAVQYPHDELTTKVAAMNHSNATSSEGSGGVIYTEQRGIQVRHISPRASKEQVHNMITQAAGPECHLIDSIEVPADKQGNSRRLAFAHYRSAGLARRMAAHLDGVDFMGRILQVRLMKDGDVILGTASAATRSSSSSSSSSNTSWNHRSSGQQPSYSSSRDDNPKDRYGSTRASSSRTSPQCRKNKSLLVVGGSLPICSLKNKGKGKNKGQGQDQEVDTSSSVDDGKKTSGVIIVDGSSGRS